MEEREQLKARREKILSKRAQAKEAKEAKEIQEGTEVLDQVGKLLQRHVRSPSPEPGPPD